MNKTFSQWENRSRVSLSALVHIVVSFHVYDITYPAPSQPSNYQSRQSHKIKCEVVVEGVGVVVVDGESEKRRENDGRDRPRE